MRKEVSIAIIVGIVFGAIILYGINLANQSALSLPKPTPTPTPVQVTTPTGKLAPKNNTLSISSHSNNQVVFEKEITLTGKALPKANIAIIWETDETIIQADDKGLFTQKISLLSGENNVQIDEVTKEKTLNNATLKLFYSSKIIE